MIGGDTTFGWAEEPLLVLTNVGPEKSERVSLEFESIDILRIATAGLLLVLTAVPDCGEELNMLLSGEQFELRLEKEGLASDSGDCADVGFET